MKQFLVLFIFVLGLTSTVNAQKKPMNVLFIISDDLNCDFSTYGHYMVKTPNIDKLAGDGLVFNNAFTNFPLCAPSRASFMTGLYPDQTGLKDLNTLVRERVPDVVTMSQNFMNNGYTAARVGKLYHYGNPSEIGTPGHDDPPSWNITVNPRGRDKDEEDKIFSITPGSNKMLGASLSWLAADGEDEEQTDGIVATESIKLLKQFAKQDNPFFLGVGFYKPHTPYVAPKKYFEMYPKDDIQVPEVPEGYFETIPKPAKDLMRRWKAQNDLPDSTARSAIQGYYATISFMDAQVGRVLDALDQLGLRENTIILFTSDHGYHLGEHGYYQKMTLFENSDRMPLVISYPGQSTKGQVTNSIVEMIDFYPTLSELAGLTIPEHVMGKSMVPILKDASTIIRENALSEVNNEYMSRYTTPTYGYTLRTCKYRYTRWEEGGPDLIEFYDRQADPAEMHNLAKDSRFADLIKELDIKLTERVKAAAVTPKSVTVTKPDNKN
ncbi:sulfatase [uncultured Draconibacterium sp.]|uniref:sulfatase n=1 Tax=uncultured Draconibacterium sp. TaxID=1573823 RepID=UPI002AA93A8A|nr:sulfatase [uncultured Draconibacterium sp.]